MGLRFQKNLKGIARAGTRAALQAYYRLHGDIVVNSPTGEFSPFRDKRPELTSLSPIVTFTVIHGDAMPSGKLDKVPGEVA